MGAIANSKIGQGVKSVLGGYDPIGAFSFEARTRDRSTGEISGATLFESYFLLAPEEYTINEGYKLKVNKTYNGSWVDDFGNDVKKITLSGSLYSFFFGSPRTSIDKFIDLSALDFLRGNYAINEFFKLRYIVSRYRDRENKVGHSPEEVALLKNYPELSGFINKINSNYLLYGAQSFEGIAFIYHDYDDNNHYEIVFNNFEIRRSKDDPFTVFYKIEMTALKEFEGKPAFKNKFLRGGIKETVQRFFSDVQKTISDVNEKIETITSIPLTATETLAAVVNGMTELEESVSKVINNISDNWQDSVSKAKKTLENLKNKQATLETSSSGLSLSDFEDEQGDLPDDVIEVHAINAKAIEICQQVAGTGLYATQDEKVTAFVQGNAELEEEDYDTETSEEDVSTDKKIEQRNSFYYTIIDGDTLFKISQKFFDSNDFALTIGEINEIKNSDFEDNALTGVSIKIPNIEFSSDENGGDNLTYYEVTGREPVSVLTEKILGNDLKLDEERGIVTTSTGDIGIIRGEESYKENILDKLKFPLGVIQEVDPSFGLPILFGDVPKELFQQKVEQRVIEQVFSDPRTKTIDFPENGFFLTEDKANIKINSTAISGKELSIEAEVIFK